MLTIHTLESQDGITPLHTLDSSAFAPYFVDGVEVQLGVSTPVTEGNDGTHIVTETTNENYTQSFSAECPGGIATVLPEHTVECTITNDDVPPTLRLVKDVYNGTGVAEDWTLFANITSGNNNRDIDDLGNSTTHHTVFASTYDLSESSEAGYSAPGTWECVDDDTFNIISTIAEVTLNIGQNVTCTVTNVADSP
jgi:hypothetical protein